MSRFSELLRHDLFLSWSRFFKSRLNCGKILIKINWDFQDLCGDFLTFIKISWHILDLFIHFRLLLLPPFETLCLSRSRLLGLDIDVKTKLKSILWKCQDFLDCRDLLFESVEIKTNLDPHPCLILIYTHTGHQLCIELKAFAYLSNKTRNNVISCHIISLFGSIHFSQEI